MKTKPGGVWGDFFDGSVSQKNQCFLFLSPLGGGGGGGGGGESLAHLNHACFVPLIQSRPSPGIIFSLSPKFLFFSWRCFFFFLLARFPIFPRGGGGQAGGVGSLLYPNIDLCVRGHNRFFMIDFFRKEGGERKT